MNWYKTLLPSEVHAILSPFRYGIHDIGNVDAYIRIGNYGEMFILCENWQMLYTFYKERMSVILKGNYRGKKPPFDLIENIDEIFIL